jgi:hypothetical protein
MGQVTGSAASATSLQTPISNTTNYFLPVGDRQAVTLNNTGATAVTIAVAR